jgi:hypothetical protein
MDGTRVVRAGRMVVQVPQGAIAVRVARLGHVVARVVPLVVALTVAAMGFAWLASTVGVLPLLGGLAIGASMFSVLIAWSLVKT